MFAGGAGAPRALLPLCDAAVPPPEAARNLAAFHLRRGAAGEALAVMQRAPGPAAPQDLALIGAAHALLARSSGNGGGGGASGDGSAEAAEHARAAREALQAAGSAPAECDTVPGRQAMASALMLEGQWADALVYLESIRDYCRGDAAFHWNYGLCLAKGAGGDRPADAAAELAAAAGSGAGVGGALRDAWRARCLVAAGRAAEAAELALRRADGDAGSDDVAEEGAAAAGTSVADVLEGIAARAYATGQFLAAARALGALEAVLRAGGGIARGGGQGAAAAAAAARLRRCAEGRVGACLGAFQAVLAGAAPTSDLAEVAALLAAVAAAGDGGDGDGDESAAAVAARGLEAVQRWADDGGVDLE